MTWQALFIRPCAAAAAGGGAARNALASGARHIELAAAAVLDADFMYLILDGDVHVTAPAATRVATAAAAADAVSAATAAAADLTLAAAATRAAAVAAAIAARPDTVLARLPRSFLIGDHWLVRASHDEVGGAGGEGGGRAVHAKLNRLNPC